MTAMTLVQVAQRAEDLERATRFYTELLGRGPLATYDPPGLVFFDLGGTRLMLETWAPSAVLYIRVDDIEAEVARLEAAGVTISGRPHVIFRHDDDTLGSGPHRRVAGVPGGQRGQQRRAGRAPTRRCVTRSGRRTSGIVASVPVMAEILLFHHIQGLTSGVHAFADRLRAAGHTVHTPDSFEGRTFGSIEEGAAYVGEVGFEAMRDRSVLHADGLPDDLVYAGFSLGVMPAQTLLQNRPGARAGLFFHGFGDPSYFGEWPGLPVQVHAMAEDEFWLEDQEAAETAAAAHDGIEIFVYPGSGHLFTDDSVADHDTAATDLVLERSLALLDRL